MEHLIKTMLREIPFIHSCDAKTVKSEEIYGDTIIPVNALNLVVVAITSIVA